MLGIIKFLLSIGSKLLVLSDIFQNVKKVNLFLQITIGFTLSHFSDYSDSPFYELTIHLFVHYGRLTNAPQRCPHPNPGSCEYVTLHDTRHFIGVITEDFEMKRLFWIFQVD